MDKLKMSQCTRVRNNENQETTTETTQETTTENKKKKKEKKDSARLTDANFKQLLSELYLQVKSKTKITQLASGFRKIEDVEKADRAYSAYKQIEDSNKQIIKNYKKLEDLYIEQNKIVMLPRIENFLLDYELKKLEINSNKSRKEQESASARLRRIAVKGELV